MRRVAALYDVHGNLPALKAVLADVAREPIDAIVSGGDVVWGPFQAECLALLQSAGALFVAGNCEREVLSKADRRSRWCREQLEPCARKVLAAWTATIELEVDGVGRVVFCHATPRSDDEILTRRTPDVDVASACGGADADLVVCGHTHVQYDRQVTGCSRLVNAGSVGMPYQGETGAFWALIGRDVQLRRTEYDVEAALSALASSGFPSALESFGESLRGTASAESATAYFESKRCGA